MIRILISGFEPTWGIKITPSGELAKLWGSEKMPVEAEIKTVVLPQLFDICTKILCDMIAEFQPHIVLMYGATQKNVPVRLERFAINIENSVMGGNDRLPVYDRPIIIGGPAAYESTLPLQYLVKHLNDRGIDTKISYDAGQHVCNSSFYGVLHYLSQHPEMNTIAGFSHISYPNEFGVIADESWSTASWAGIKQASVVLAQESINWYIKKYGPAK
jgi:pyroglutamyl-peptidase